MKDKPMIIDSHTHIFRDGGPLDCTAVDLIKSMDEAHIDKALVFAGKINNISTEEVLAEIRPFKDRLFAIGSISPDNNRYKEESRVLRERTAYLLESGEIRGLKFYPGYEHFYPADEWLRPYLELA